MTEHPLANHPKPPPRGEDLPYDDGEPMETARHRDQMVLLIDTLRRHAASLPTLHVGGNEFVYFSETQAKRNDFRGPDVYVVLGRPQQDIKSWVVWEQDGHLPDVIIELLSPKTEKVDRGKKLRIYRDVMKVQRYYLFDPYTFLFEGYALVDGVYRPLEPNAAGRLECRPIGLELGVQETESLAVTLPMLRWFEPSGQVLATDREWADTERERADQAERAAAETRTRADAEKTRAEDAQARADAERTRADALEARVAALEARLKGE